MKDKVRFLGLDVHAETITVAIAEQDGEMLSLGTIPNRAESIRKLVKKLGPVEQLRACYEAGPTGYALYWQLTELGVDCAVIAPTLAPMKAGDRVKTDRRDAERLARSHRAGDLTAVWVPDEGSEALRDLVRAREAAKQDQLRARHRLSKFLLRQGRRPATGIKTWTVLYMTWVRQLRFTQPAQEATRLDYLQEVEHMAERIKRLEQAIADALERASPQMQAVVQGLQALRGIALISAVTIISEVGQISRFQNARQLMGYSGAVPRENSSGQRTQRGSITKAGNAHLRRIAIEAAWSYRLRPAMKKSSRTVPQQTEWKQKPSITVGLDLGLRPRQSQSGDSDPEHRITKTGNIYLRRLLLQSAHYILPPQRPRPVAGNRGMGRFGLDSALPAGACGLAGTGGKRAKKRALVAVARKLAVILNRMWRSGERYQPFPEQRQAVTAAA